MNINAKRLVGFMEEIINISSPSGDTKEAIDRVQKEFEELNIPFKITNKGAICATIDGEDTNKEVMVTAHMDTLGAVVKEIKPNGRLKLSTIGGYSWTSVEGENVRIKTIEDKVYTGTILCEKTSVHIFPEETRHMQRDEDVMEVRIDECTSSAEETRKLGIEVGDFVSFEPRFMLTESGFIKSRHLDDKACVAMLIECCRYLKENNLKPKFTTHFFISNYEEIGHGLTNVSKNISEIVASDIGTVGGNLMSDERKVTILAKDKVTPYNLELKRKLVNLAKKNNIDYVIDVFNSYGSDASCVLLQGVDAKVACIGLGVDATHHYERTHIDGVINNTKLILAYLLDN